MTAAILVNIAYVAVLATVPLGLWLLLRHARPHPPAKGGIELEPTGVEQRCTCGDWPTSTREIDPELFGRMIDGEPLTDDERARVFKEP